MSDTRRKNVRFDDKRSKSTRGSTVGGSSTSSSNYSGAAHSLHSSHSDQYADQRYNIAALEDTVQRTLNELDGWKNQAIESEARCKALQLSNDELDRDKKVLEKEVRDVKNERDSLRKEAEELRALVSKMQRKIERTDSQSEPSSPDSGKPRRRESKKSKESEQRERLKDRLNKHSGENPNSEISSSKPPTSSKTPHKTRRLSTSSHHAEKPYVEKWGPAGPAITKPTAPIASNIRRLDTYITTAGYAMPSPSVSIPRSAGIPRPSVEYVYSPNSAYREDGNYHAHPLPPRQ